METCRASANANINITIPVFVTVIANIKASADKNYVLQHMTYVLLFTKRHVDSVVRTYLIFKKFKPVTRYVSTYVRMQ